MPKQCRALRIESTCQKIECDAAAVCAQYLRVAQTRERVVIGDEIKRFTLGLQRDLRPNHPKVMADVQSTAWLDTGKDSHAFFLCHVERSRDISNCLIGCAFKQCREIPRLRSE